MCSVNITCYTSIFLAKRGPWHRHGPCGAWKPLASVTQHGLASLPRQNACLGKVHVIREKVDFISSASHSKVGPCFVKHVFGKWLPVSCRNPDGGSFLSVMSEFYICWSQQVYGANEKKWVVCPRNLTAQMWFWGTFKSRRHRAIMSTRLLGLGIVSAGRGLNTT